MSIRGTGYCYTQVWPKFACGTIVDNAA